MNPITVRVDRPEGGHEDLELDLDLGSFTMRESVRLEEAVGPEVFARLMAAGLDATEMASPRIVQGVIYAKLKTVRPDITLESFDLDLEDLAAALGVEEEPAPLVDSGEGSNP